MVILTHLGALAAVGLILVAWVAVLLRHRPQEAVLPLPRGEEKPADCMDTRGGCGGV